MADVFIYCYYFNGVEAPLTVQATCRTDARKALPGAIKGSPDHAGMTTSDIRKETVYEPITGVTRRKEGEQWFVWGGQEKGWERQG